MKKLVLFTVFVSMCLSFSIMAEAKNVLDADWDDVVEGRCDDQWSGWWSSSEAIRIANNVLLYQKEIGGWPKNIKMQLVLTQDEIDALIAAKPGNADCTIDNGAVWLELKYLSKVHKAVTDTVVKAELKTGFLKGIQYLLDAQYDNGGWPQYYPIRSGYSQHITYNDDAMTHVLEILMHIYKKDSEYSIVAADSTVADAKVAFDKGIECTLNTQYLQEGLLTSWCAQHHYETLEPALARSYELPSLSGSEAGKVAEFLMTIKNPSYAIRRAIYHVVNWYDDVRIKGIRIEDFVNGDGLDDIRVVPDANAPDLWARFYTLEDNTPFFCDRDGIKKYTLAEIGYERRNGYSWYTNEGSKVFSAYSSWYTKYGSNTEQETIILSPDSGAIYLTTGFPVKANANEYSFGCIKNFELYVDDVLISDFASEKIDTLLADLSVGTHTIIVKSTDNKGFSTGDTSIISVVPGFSLTINSGSGNGYYAEGAEASIKADAPPEGKIFDKWTGDTLYVADVNKSSTTVTMPASDIIVTATYMDKPNGISDILTRANELHCFPNPTSSGFSIDLRKIGNSSIEIFDVQGRKVFHEMAHKGIHSINNHGLHPGIYFIKVSSENKDVYSQKLLIK